MTLTEEKNLTEIRDDIENRILDKYPSPFERYNKKCFRANDNTFFIVSSLRWDGDDVIVAEYADSEIEAKKGLFGEDGEMFYINEMSEKEILEAIIREVEG